MILRRGRRFNISSMGLCIYETDMYGRNFIISLEDAHVALGPQRLLVTPFNNRHEVVDWLNSMDAADFLKDEKNQIDDGDDDND
jgi:hypothetical protein